MEDSADQDRGGSCRRPRDAHRTRHDILIAAGQHFARRGYSRVTLKEIADDVGITPAMIVRYFDTKLALFEEVVTDDGVPLLPAADAERSELLEDRARDVVAFFQDRVARSGGVALLRSLDVDDGALFRSEIERRILRPWSAEITGPDADLRVRLVAGVILGVGMFTLGALTDPDQPPLDPADAEQVVNYVSKLLAVCIDG